MGEKDSTYSQGYFSGFNLLLLKFRILFCGSTGAEAAGRQLGGRVATGLPASAPAQQPASQPAGQLHPPAQAAKLPCPALLPCTHAAPTWKAAASRAAHLVEADVCV